MRRYYRLDGQTPVPCSLDEWMQWQTDGADKSVAADRIGESLISTVFLGLDHQFMPGPPLLFETMIFGGPADGDQWRCETYAEALAMHHNARRIVQLMANETEKAIERAKQESNI